MINKKNYYVLAGMLLVLVLAYLGVLTLFGFSDCWGLWRKISFALLTYVAALLPSIALLYFYQRTAK